MCRLLTIGRPRLRPQAGGEAVESIVVYDVVAACGCGAAAAAVPGVVGAGCIAVGEADPVARRAREDLVQRRRNVRKLEFPALQIRVKNKVSRAEMRLRQGAISCHESPKELLLVR